MNGSKVSIHAPARGATGLSAIGGQSNTLFQSTPLREGRQLLCTILS